MGERNLALIYSRKSVVRDPAMEISNERQEQACIREAQAHGWLWEVYRDQDESGRTEDRPGWQLLRQQLWRKEVAAVVVESLSRANRSVRDFFNFLAELDKHEVALISVKERIDTSTAMGRAFIGFIAILNQLEADLAGERMAMTIEYRQREGRHWGLTPYGCERDERHNLIPSTTGVWLATTGQWVVGDQGTPPFAVEDGAAWLGYHAGLQQLYELYAGGGHSYHSVMVEMNIVGWPFRTRRGLPRRWSVDDVRRALQAWRLYAGELPLGRQKDRQDEEVVVEGAHEPILPLELCQRVGALLEQRGKQRRGRRPHRVYILSNILYCHACGARLYGNWQKGLRNYAHYRRESCTANVGRVRCEIIDEQIIEQLRMLHMPFRMIGPPDEPPAKRDEAAVKALAARAGLARKLERLREMRIEGEISKEEYYRRKSEVQVQIAELPVVEERRELGWPAMLARLEAMGELLATASPAMQKRAIDALFQRVEIDLDTERIVRAEPRPWCRAFF